MTLALITATPEGITLAADSRQSYINQKGVSRIGSDSASKVFQLTEKVGLVIAGIAFLPEGNVLKNISKFIKDFIKMNPNMDNMTVDSIAQKLNKYFESKYDYRKNLGALKEQHTANLLAQGFEVVNVSIQPPHVVFEVMTPKKEPQTQILGVDTLQFIIAGFNPDGSHEVFNVTLPGGIVKLKDSRLIDMDNGASWIGQGDVVNRIIKGLDHRFANLPFVQEHLKDHPGIDILPQLNQLEYNIQWGTMTLQDAVDFSILAIKTTSAIQRFSDGIRGDPGDMPGVGGPVDVAVITLDEGFSWVDKKALLLKSDDRA